MLPVHGPPLGPPSSHGDLWFAAAAAAIKAGRDADAAPLLERLQAGHERMFAMEAYGRSFFLLGQIYERRGETWPAHASNTPASWICGGTAISKVDGLRKRRRRSADARSAALSAASADAVTGGTK